MRRTHGSGAYAPERRNAFEEESDNLVEGLNSKTNALKSLCIDIGAEIRNQKNLLDDMDDDFDRTHGFLTNTIGRVGRLIKAGHYRYIFYLIGFSFFVFCVIYVIIKLR